MEHALGLLFNMLKKYLLIDSNNWKNKGEMGSNHIIVQSVMLRTYLLYPAKINLCNGRVADDE